jgi:hypothetical protein
MAGMGSEALVDAQGLMLGMQVQFAPGVLGMVPFLQLRNPVGVILRSRV